MPTFLITGASGFIGRASCSYLIKNGRHVVTLVRHYDKTLEASGVKQIVSSDWTADLGKLPDITHIIHCAGDASFGNGTRYKVANIGLTAILLDLTRWHCPGLKRFVFVSSIGAVDRAPSDDCSLPLNKSSVPCPSSDYGKSKIACEKLVRESGLPFAILRPAMVVGEQMRFGSHFSVFARNALKRGVFSRFNWSGKFSVIHVEDLAAALLCIAEKPEAENETFFCAGGNLALGAFFRSVTPDVFRIPIAFAKKFFFTRRFWSFQLKALLLPALTASDAKLRALGWQPKFSALSALECVLKREKSRLSHKTTPRHQTVITGASSGLGRAFVERLAPLRRNLLCVDIDKNGLDSLRLNFPEIRTFQVDLSSLEGIQECLSSPVSELYACAGIGPRGDVQKIPFTVQGKTFTVNVLAQLALGQDAVEAMCKEQFGRVVLISSSSAFQPLPHMATYASTNSALLSLGEAWAYEAKSQGVLILTVCPGGMRTNFQKNNNVREVSGKKLMPPEEAVDRILKKVDQGKTLFFLSARSFAMAFAARILPRGFSVRLWAFLMHKLR